MCCNLILPAKGFLLSAQTGSSSLLTSRIEKIRLIQGRRLQIVHQDHHSRPSHSSSKGKNDEFQGWEFGIGQVNPHRKPSTKSPTPPRNTRCFCILALRRPLSERPEVRLVVSNPPNKPLSADLLSPQRIHRFLCSFQKRVTFYYTLRIWLDYTLCQHSWHNIRLELFTKEFILMALVFEMDQEEMECSSNSHSSRNASERPLHQPLLPKAPPLIRPSHTLVSTHRMNL